MERPSLPRSGPRGLKLKVGALLVLIPLVAVGLGAYALHSRGVFEPWRKITLIARDAEGVSVGMPVMFSGFAIGNVAAMELADDGRVRVALQIREKDARWLRTSTVFALEKQLVGAAKIRVSTPNMQDPPLPEEAQRELESRDAAADIPAILDQATRILEGIEQALGRDSSLNRSLANLETVTARMRGEYGLLEAVTGSAQRARQVVRTIERAQSLVASIESMLAKSEQRILGEQGILSGAQRSIDELHAILAETRESLKKVDATLANVQAATGDVKAVGANVAAASADLVGLRADVDASIAKVNRLLTEINRKWPFQRETQIGLP